MSNIGDMTPPILVTGANSGIGLAVVLALLQAGATVIATDQFDSRLKTLAESSDRMFIHLCDLSSECDVDTLVEGLRNRYDALSGLVIAAGMTHEGFIGEFALEDWNIIMRVNVSSAFQLLKGVLPLLTSGESSSVVAIGSVSASLIGAGGGCAAYEASKAALTQLVRALAVEYASSGLRANIVAPGEIVTNLAQHRDMFLADGVLKGKAENRRPAFTKERPIRKAGNPENVASMVCYLLSKEASFITGTEIRIDGGFSAI